MVEAEIVDSDGKAQSDAANRLKRNIVANLVGRAWTAVLGLAFVPLYIRFLGMEAYGLIGFYATLLAVFSLLDMGLSTTLNREMARRSVEKDGAQDMRDMTRTLEMVYWVLALVIACSVALLSAVIAERWIKASELPPSTIRAALIAMGIAMALQFPFALYQGGLLGLQRQVLLNGILVTMATLRGGGAVLVLWLVSPTIQAYFAWQIAVSAMQLAVSAWFLWRSLPRGTGRARFSRGLLAEVWRFAAGIAGISASAVLLTQLDKVILSKILPLEMYGYYALAATVAGSLMLIATPIFTALFPRFSQLVALRDDAGLAQLYHSASQVMSVVLLPAAAVLVFFAPELLLAWTRDLKVTGNTHVLVSVLVTGSALNGLVTVPYALQLAHGWTRLGLCVNAAAVVVLTPAIVLMASRYGAVGAAWVWVALNTGYLLVMVQIMHRRLLKAEKLRWYCRDVGMPLVAALVCAGAGRWLVPAHLPLAHALASIAGIAAVAAVAAALAASEARGWLLGRLGMRKTACGN